MRTCPTCKTDIEMEPEFQSTLERYMSGMPEDTVSQVLIETLEGYNAMDAKGKRTFLAAFKRL